MDWAIASVGFLMSAVLIATLWVLYVLYKQAARR